MLATTMAAKSLGVSVPTLRKVPPNELPYYKIGTHRRYEESDLIAYKETIMRHPAEPGTQSGKLN